MLDGTLEGEGRTYDIGPGFFVSAGAAKQWTFGSWFVTGTFAASVSRTSTLEAVPGATRETLFAVDIFRLGAMAGRRLGIVSPYVMARGFGGPVSWQLDGMDVTGSDTHFFQLGGGATLTTASGLSLVVDVSVLGEQSASLGMAMRL